MNNPKNIQDELRSLESGLPVNNIQPFSVPDGYFEGLATIMLAKVKNIEVSAGAEISELSPLLAGIPKTTPYAVPSSYFENTLEDISGLTKESDSPMLNAIGKNTPFSVPEGYFENLPVEIMAKVSKPKAKVVPLFGRTWMRVASAAAIAGALFLGGYQLLRDNSKELPSTAATQNESIDQNLLASNTQPIEKDIREASTKELEDFIATVQANPESTTENIKSTSDRTEVEELLKDVSTKEMESFLSAMPMTDDDFLTTN
jgi:hypothetical protein